MKHRCGIMMLTLAIVATSAAFAPPTRPKNRSSPPTSRPSEDDWSIPRNLAVQAMRKVVKNADFKEMPFEDFVEWLERTTQATVVVRWKLLEDVGVRREQPITLRLKNVPLRKLIELVLDQLQRDDPAVRLAAKADDNTLILSTVRDLFRELVTRTYDVQDLLLTVPHFTGGKINPPNGGSARGLSLIRPGGSEQDQKTEEQAQRLIETITSHIQPESWKANGGEGTISFFKGRLIIHNNLLVHEQLGGGSPPSLQKP